MRTVDIPKPLWPAQCKYFLPRFFNSHSWENDLWDHGNLNLKSVKYVTASHKRKECKREPEIKGMVLRLFNILQRFFNIQQHGDKRNCRKKKSEWNFIIRRTNSCSNENEIMSGQNYFSLIVCIRSIKNIYFFTFMMRTNSDFYYDVNQ